MGNKKSGFGFGDLVDIGLSVVSPTALIGKKVLEKAVDYYQESQEPEEDPYLEDFKGGITLYNEGKYDEARDRFIIAMQSDDEETRRKSVVKYKESTDAWYRQLEKKDCGFVDYNFTNRQFILLVRDVDHIAGCFDSDGVINWTFTMSDYPQDIEFSTGRPEPNMVYAAHPIQTDLYLPFSKFEEMVFTEKVNELCRLAQALGATEIAFRSIKGRSVEETSDYNWGVGANGEYKGVGGNGDYRQKGNYQSSRSGRNTHERVQRFAPMYSPFIPEDLLWFDQDKTWQTMAKQRIDGNILHYTLKISSSEACNMSNGTSHDVKASFDAMVAKGDVHFGIEQNQSSSSSNETEWEVSIDFEDKRNLTEEYNVEEDNTDDYIASNYIDTPNRDKAAMMPILDVFWIEGRGVVVYGRLDTGVVSVGDQLQIVGFGQDKRVELLSVAMSGKLLDTAEAGDECGLLISNIQENEVKQGMVICEPDTVETGNHFTAEISVEKGTIKSGCGYGLFVNTAETQGIITLKNGVTMLREGESSVVEITISDQVPLPMYAFIGVRDDESHIVGHLDTILPNTRSSSEKETLESGSCESKGNDDEYHYIKTVEDCLADGEIGPRERRLLDKIREKLGISPERAAELEATLAAPQLTEEEKEYLTEFKECAVDGVVSDKERRLLEKMRNMLGISEERAKELEQM